MKRIFVILASVLFGVFSAFCSRESMPRPLASTLVKPFEDYYGGNPNTSQASLYMYLCRKGCDPRSKKCVCDMCKGNWAGLSLGFICVDEENGEEFDGIGPNTSNLLWSMHVSFSKGEGSECCHAPGMLTAKYCYNPRVYSQLEMLTDDGDIPENPSFLHEEGGRKCERRDDRGRYDGKELCVTHTLRTALFRVRVPYVKKVSEVLEELGKVGEEQKVAGQDSRVLLPYSRIGVNGHNCATFCREAMHVLAPFPTMKWHIRPVPMVVGFGSAAASGAGFGTLVCPGIGTAVGAGIGVAVEGAVVGISCLVKRAEASKPESVVDMVLNFFQEQYEKGDDITRQAIDSFFSVVAHDRTKINHYVEAPTAGFNPNDYSELEYKTIKDVIARKVRISKVEGKLFFKEDFEEKSDDGCSVM